jgi:hypothetical protein
MTRSHFHKMMSPHFTGHSNHSENRKDLEIEEKIERFFKKLISIFRSKNK